MFYSGNGGHASALHLMVQGAAEAALIRMAKNGIEGRMLFRKTFHI